MSTTEQNEHAHASGHSMDAVQDQEVSDATESVPHAEIDEPAGAARNVEPEQRNGKTPESPQAADAAAGATDGDRQDQPEIALPPPLRADSSLETAGKAFDEYMLRKGFSENTIKAFRNDLKIFTEYAGADTKLMSISTRDLDEYLEWLQSGRGKPCSAKTLTRRITTLKVFFGWLYGVGILGSDPAEPVIQQSARTPLPTILRDDEVNRVVRAAQDYLWDRPRADARPYLLVSLLLQTGMKKAECANLLISDIEASHQSSPSVRIQYADERNSHKNRTLTLHPNIVPPLKQYLEQYKPSTHLFECTPRNLEYVLRDVGERAGIRSGQVGFETLRWTAAVIDYRHGLPEEQLRQKLGLSKISWRETREKIHQLTNRR